MIHPSVKRGYAWGMSATESPGELVERLRREREAEVTWRGAADRMAVAITGGRQYTPSRQDMERFWEIFDRLGPTELHHGDSRGVDHFVAAAVRRLRPGVKIVAHPAQWELHGKAAGPHRNREMMLVASDLIAFPGGRGTRSCEVAAQQLGRRIHYVVERAAPVVVAAHGKPVGGHEHAVKDWWWSTARAAWTGRCGICRELVVADRKTASLLERLVADAPLRTARR